MEKPKLLVIDDDANVRKLVRVALQKRDYEISEASNGEEGLRKAGVIRPDLVLSDVFMGGTINGYDVLQALRSTPATSSASIILMTGNTTDADLRKSMESGADDYLPKPFELNALLAAVEAQLQKRRRLKEHEAEIESRLLAVLEATTDLVWMIDYRSGRVLYMNRSGRSMLGISLEEDLGHSTFEAFHPVETLDRIKTEAFPSAAKGGVWSGETIFRRRDGSNVATSQVILAHTKADGEIDYLSTIARDITARKKAERERDMMEVQLRHAQKLESIGQLAAGIAHEINTPAQYIGDNLRFLRDAFRDLSQIDPLCRDLIDANGDQEKMKSTINEIERIRTDIDSDYLLTEIPVAIAQGSEGAERVSKLVRAMKDFSHPGSEDKVLTDINRAIESTLTVCRNEWKYQAELFTEFDQNLPHVACLPGEINQVILNLIVNAAHAMEKCKAGGNKGVLSVATRHDGDWAEIRIQDTGTGIPDSIRDRIFDPFFTTKEVGRGTGQGLAIARSIVVDKHGGTIRFESKIGRGTTFIIRLPVAGSLNQKEAA